MATDKQVYLKSVVEDHLFWDVLLLQNVTQPDNLRQSAVLLAFQLGNEVSYNEPAKNLQLDVKTVQRYLSLLEQSFVIFKLDSFNRNLRKEVAKSKKYYFWDLGMRNVLIGQLSELQLRSDRGALWENYLEFVG